jgi:hypothetical protein
MERINDCAVADPDHAGLADWPVGDPAAKLPLQPKLFGLCN